MNKKVEILLSVMNIKTEEQYNQILKQNKITGKVLTVNQVEDDVINIIDGDVRIYSYKEKGASNSRNRLLEKAQGDICAFADDDTIYVENYEQIILKEYEKNPKADMIIFYIENENKQREKIKKIGNKKMNNLDVMRVRTPEITFKRETLKKLQEANIKFDKNFGPGGIFQKGEETIFISDILKSGIKVYSTTKKIGVVQDTKSTWFKGYNEQFLHDQGAIFYRIAPKTYKLLILQYVIRKYNLYKENINIVQAYKQMELGAKKCKEIKK